MKVQNFTTLLLPSRKQRERNQLIANSLASSAAILDRIPAFSDSNNRGRPFVLRFHQQWRHDSCQVMGWYKQQCSSSTRFRFIEHRRNTEGPFYHEFLLLKLTDGAIYRVERMGDGSRTGAIRYTGCRANDLVQWFTADDYTVLAATIPSELLAEIAFPHEYDVLDVLAVCYSIQNTRGCRVYTLQRYNCYFLCLTILAVLTRRVANWDLDTAATTWDTFISSTFDRFSGSETEDMNRYLVLRICALLEPEDTTPTKPALDAIRHHLNSQNSIANLNDSLRGTLWAASWGQALRSGLNNTVTATVTTLLQDTRAGPTRLRNIVHAVRRDVHRGIVANETLADPYCKELSKMVSQYCDRKHEIYQRRFHAIEMERHFSLWSRAVSKALGYVLAAVVGMYPAMWIVNEDE